MGLQLLPTEILARIIKETLPESFESCALTCKSVYNASKFLLQKYNALKRQYGNFTYRQGPHGNTCTSAILLLARIAEEPLIARYMVSANFVQDSPPASENLRTEHIEAVTSSRILSLLEDSSYVQEASVDPAVCLQYMLDAYQADDADLAALFLLTLLPNVTHLALPERWNDYNARGQFRTSNLEPPRELDDILDAIVIKANDPSQPSAGLSKLEALLPSTSWGYDSWALSSFNPFLSIKSVRSFCAGSCRAIDDGYTGAAFEAPKFETFGVGLEDVELVGSVVDDIELRKFLSRLPKLRGFKLSYEVKWHGCGHEIDCGPIIKAIEEEVGGSLEELSFSMLNDWPPVLSYIGSLKKFKRLKHLEVDLGLFIGPQGPDNQDSRGDSEIVAKRRLADLLPPTVESICLLVEDINKRGGNRLLNDFFIDVATDSEKFPNLKGIKIRTKPYILAGHPRPFDEQVLSLEDFIHYSEESESNSAQELQDDKAARNSAKYPLNRAWMMDLKGSDQSIQIKIIKVGSILENSWSGHQIVLPEFMANFRNQYGVENLEA